MQQYHHCHAIRAFGNVPYNITQWNENNKLSRVAMQLMKDYHHMKHSCCKFNPEMLLFHLKFNSTKKNQSINNNSPSKNRCRHYSIYCRELSWNSNKSQLANSFVNGNNGVKYSNRTFIPQSQYVPNRIDICTHPTSIDPSLTCCL